MTQKTSRYDVLPLLGRGKHRNPRKGACFMELASYLSGEQWSDSPACTHPLLAHMARLVNDFSDDRTRPRLSLLIPSVIGLQSHDPRWDHELTLLAGAYALPVAAEPSQRALAVGMLASERLYAAYEGRPVGSMTARTREAFEQVPLVEQWAREFMAKSRTRGSEEPGQSLIECATRSIAFACVPEPDDLLRELLIDAIDLCRSLAGRDEEPSSLTQAEWSAVCRPVHA